MAAGPLSCRRAIGVAETSPDRQIAAAGQIAGSRAVGAVGENGERHRDRWRGLSAQAGNGAGDGSAAARRSGKEVFMLRGTDHKVGKTVGRPR